MWVEAEECGVRFEEAVPPATLKQIQLQGAVEVQTLSKDML